MFFKGKTYLEDFRVNTEMKQCLCPLSLLATFEPNFRSRREAEVDLAAKTFFLDPLNTFLAGGDICIILLATPLWWHYRFKLFMLTVIQSSKNLRHSTRSRRCYTSWRREEEGKKENVNCHLGKHSMRLPLSQTVFSLESLFALPCSSEQVTSLLINHLLTLVCQEPAVTPGVTEQTDDVMERKMLVSAS